MGSINKPTYLGVLGFGVIRNQAQCSLHPPRAEPSGGFAVSPQHCGQRLSRHHCIPAAVVDAWVSCV